MLAFGGGLVLSLALTGLLIPFLRRGQFVDLPNHRSSHVMPTPRGGGLAVMVAIALALALYVDFDLWSVVAASAALALVGLVDDMHSLPGGVRLLTQVCAAVAVVVWMSSEGILSAWWWAPVVFVMVGFVNAFNFMDGVNGISGLTAVVVGLYWAFVGHRSDLLSVELLGLAMAGAAVGFLPWNAFRAKVFLGDVGSYGLGMLIGALSVVAWASGVHWLVAAAPLVVYVADTGWAVAKRAQAGRPLMEAHREHVYQRLVDGGWSHLRAAGLCAAVGALACVSAFLTWRSAPIVGVAVVAALAAAYLAAPRLVLGSPEATS